MAAAIKAKTGLQAELVPGGRGAFEVIKDGKTVYSKLAKGRFPDSDDEVFAALG